MGQPQEMTPEQLAESHLEKAVDRASPLQKELYVLRDSEKIMIDVGLAQIYFLKAILEALDARESS